MKRLITLLTVLLLMIGLIGCTLNKDNTSDENQNNEKTNQNSNNNKTDTKNDSDGVKEPKQTKETLPDISEYYPITKNTRYSYEGIGNEYSTFTVYPDYISETKVQQRVENGGTVMANVLEIKDGKLTKVYSRGEAYYRENLLKLTGENQEIMLMEPLKKGTTWTLKDGSIRTITNMTVDLTTPSGNYKAIEVTTDKGNDKTLDYYAKDVGLVKSVFVTGETEISSTLSKVEENVPLVQNITFYYPNINDDKIYYQSRPVSFYTNEITRKVLTAAYKGQSPNQLGTVFSKNTEINSLYLNQDGNVYLDLNKAFIEEMSAGAAFEGLILQSIVNTVGQYYQCEKVFLTIDNQPYESGHISMNKGESFKVQSAGTIEIK
ncbi:GerMN domain-containing protein [Bacillus sp. T3]|uniref:GerMN domain-containing protein n=1 Tax=Bacillus sp. T3 TaxID=467262 RepID=UPI002980D3F0|nr:GerMN domain-containing protein [Bacillus sp. T3]